MNKVLIACPTSKNKNYCFHDWAENTMSLNHPLKEIVVFDNTDDGGENADYLNTEFKKMFGRNNSFKAIHSKVDGIKSVIERMTISSNEMRDYFLNGNYSHLYSLESDVFPPKDIIQNLMFRNKKIVGALYYRDSGKWRKLTVQTIVKRSPYKSVSFNMSSGEEQFIVDGNLHKVASVGLGSVLIHRSVVEKIKFRCEKGLDIHPDTFWSQDCALAGFSIFADTAEMCRHDNQSWVHYENKLW